MIAAGAIGVLVTSIKAYEIATATAKTVTELLKLATGELTMKQVGLNTAMLASPTFQVITSIVALTVAVSAFVWGLNDIATNGANAKNTLITLTGAVGGVMSVIVALSKLLKVSLSPSLMTAAGGFTALVVGITAVISQWNNMSGAERVISVLGLLAIAASSAAIAFGALQSAWSLGVAAAAIIAGIVAITASVDSASKRAEALSGLYPESQDFTANIPQLAKGAVLPANKPFLAMVGDQKHGTNVEAPLDTIKQAVYETVAEMDIQGGSTTINFTGNLSQLARVLKPQIERENKRVGTKLVTGGGY